MAETYEEMRARIAAHRAAQRTPPREGMRWTGFSWVEDDGKFHGLAPISKKKLRAMPAEDRIRQAVFERDGHRCVLHVLTDHECDGPLTFHHLVKSGQCGEFSMRNGLTVCWAGNGHIEDNPEWARAYGLSIAKEVDEVDAAKRRDLYDIAPQWPGEEP